MNAVQEQLYVYWRFRLDAIDGNVFSSNHKLVAAHLQVIFKSEGQTEEGYYRVKVGSIATKNNLIGQTGLSNWTIYTVIDELALNGLVIKRTYQGTAENSYLDACLYLKPTHKWIAEEFAIQEKSKRRYRKVCPHCFTELKTGDIIFTCKHCGSQFDKPLVKEVLDEQQTRKRARKHALSRRD